MLRQLQKANRIKRRIMAEIGRVGVYADRHTPILAQDSAENDARPRTPATSSPLSLPKGLPANRVFHVNPAKPLPERANPSPHRAVLTPPTLPGTATDPHDANRVSRATSPSRAQATSRPGDVPVAQEGAG